MLPNRSPWIEQLDHTRPSKPLEQDASTDIAIVGGGIAGAVTAFFALRETDKKVILVEAGRIAHGATGHNAGQITSYFERPLSDLVVEFGLKLATEAQSSIESAWSLLDQIVDEAKLKTPLYRFTGYAGLATFDQVMARLEDNRNRLAGGLPLEEMTIAKEWDRLADIPADREGLYSTAPHADIMSLLETRDSSYIAALSYQKGCMNSALFTEELIEHLSSTYSERFSFFENSPVETVVLKSDSGILEIIGGHKVISSRIILCTNGFEKFSVKNTTGTEIDTKFHHSVIGRVGYMSGYIEPMSRPPTAISYFPRTGVRNEDPTGESYVYLTRRPQEHDDRGDSHNLVCAGGPEKLLPEGVDYSPEDSCSEEMRDIIDGFLKKTYANHPGETVRSFCWHGLMGYTPNGIRRVGPEPCNPVLLYNLGCNGVGILPSIFGAKRISRFLKGEKVERSIFDPRDQRCELP